MLYVMRADTSLARPRSSRGRKEVGVVGHASWISSVINLLNTSMFRHRQIMAVR